MSLIWFQTADMLENGTIQLADMAEKGLDEIVYVIDIIFDSEER